VLTFCNPKTQSEITDMNQEWTEEQRQHCQCSLNTKWTVIMFLNKGAQ